MTASSNARILFVTTNHYAPTGGSEVLWSRSAERLGEQGIEIGASARAWQPLPAHLIRLSRLKCDMFLVPSEPHNLVKKVLNVAAGSVGRSTLARFGEWLDRAAPDLVLFSMGNSVEGFEWIGECKRRSRPYALLVQLVSEHNWLPDDGTDRMMEIYEGARACFFVSEGNRRLVEKMGGFGLNNAHIVQNPYGVSYDAAFEWPESDGVFRLACVANLHALHKGQDILFEVLRQEKWRKRPLECSLFGAGPHKRILERLKARWKLHNVHFRGYSEDIAEVWKSHHALVMPSRMEGLPLALKEAVLCGRVPIVTDVGGNSELIDDGVNGFLVPAPAAALLDATLERAWKRRSEWADIGYRAYQDAHARISADPVGDFAQILRKLASEKV